MNTVVLLLAALFLFNNATAQNVFTPHYEGFSASTYNTSGTGNISGTFTGNTGTWSASSDKSYASVSVLNNWPNWTPNCLRLRNYKGSSTSNAQVTSPTINLSGYSCSQKVWFDFHYIADKLNSNNTGTTYKIEFYNGTTWVNVLQKTASQIATTNPDYQDSYISLTSAYLISTFKYRITATSIANNSYDSELYFDDLIIYAEPCRTNWSNTCTDSKDVDFYSKGMKGSCNSGTQGWTNIGSAEGLNMSNATKVVAYVSMSETGTPAQTVTIRSKNSSGTVLQTVTATLANNQDDPSDINIYEATLTTSLSSVASIEASISGSCSITSSTNPSYIANGLGLAVFRSSVSGTYNQGELKYWGAPGNGSWDYYKGFTFPSTTYARTVLITVSVSGLKGNGDFARIKIDGSTNTTYYDIKNNGTNGDRITTVTIPYTLAAYDDYVAVATDYTNCPNNGLYSIDAIKASVSCAVPLTLGNIVWVDTNGNGIKDASDPGYEGATVKLYLDANNNNVPDGAAIQTTTTASDGSYSFTGLVAGNYIAAVTLPSGYVATATTTTSSNPNNDTDNDNNGVTTASGQLRSNYISLSVGGEPTTDGDGNNGNLTLDFGIKLDPSGPCAGGYNPTYVANGYDLFIQQGLTLTGGHTDGGVATGGNLTLAGSSILAMNNSGNYPLGYNLDNNYGLVVGGKINYTSGGVTYVNNGKIKLASTTGSTLWATDPNGASVNLRITSNASTGWTGYNSTPAVQLQDQQTAASVTQATGIDFTTTFTTLAANAVAMSGYTSSSACASSLNIITPSGTTPTVTLVADKVNVINVTGATFDSYTQITFSGAAPSATTPLIFNINQAASLTFSTFNTAGLSNSAGQYIIYNFYNNTGTITINANNAMIGSIFAPSATVIWNGSNNLEGQIIAKSASLVSGEIHSQIFDACLPICSSLNLGNLVWYDVDGDGIKETNEPGISGATVKLYLDANGDNTPDGAAIATTTTDGSGLYGFSGLAANKYIVGVTIPTGYVVTGTTTNSSNPNSDTDNDNNGVTTVSGEVRSNFITLSSGGEPASGVDGDGTNGNLTLDFGFKGALNLGNNVWYDVDGDGIKETGEPAVSGATVNLYLDANGDNTPDGGVVATTTTDASGVYAFTALAPGNYIVGVVMPTGYTATATTATSANPNNDTDNDNNGVTTVSGELRSNYITLSTGGEPASGVDGDGTSGNLTLDFGLKGSLNLGNLVWYDVDGDGIKETNETGISGATVKLYLDANGDNTPDGAAIATTTTSSTGIYGFSNLVAANYIVGVTIPTGYVVTGTTTNSSNPNSDTDNDNNGVTTVSGEVRSNYVTLTVGGEPASGVDGDGTNGNLTVDFGFKGSLNLGNNVWYDVDGDGIKETGEPIVSGATVNLYLDANGDNIPDGGVVATTATNASGVYAFTALAPGNYIVGVVLPTGYVGTTVIATSANPNNDTDNDNNGVTTVSGELRSNYITLSTSGEPAAGVDGDGTNGNLTLDFGLRGTLNLGNLVWYDVNNNGLYTTNEPIISGATVNLYLDANGDNTPDGTAVATTTTNASGVYAFTALTAGNYIVGVVTPTGYVATTTITSSANPNNDTNNDNNGVTTVSGELRSNYITLSIGGEPASGVDGDGTNGNLTLDFGFKGTLNLGNQIWYDQDIDGKKDPGEVGFAALESGVGLSSVTVYLYQDANGDNVADGAAINSMTVPASTGIYGFSNLAPGNYIVGVVVPSEYSGTKLLSTSSNPNNDTDNDNNGINTLDPVGLQREIRTGYVTLSIGGEPASGVDGDGTNGNLTVDIGFALAILPVDLISFNGALNENIVKLNFTVANEINMDRYEIEKSIDGISFTRAFEVATTTAQGTKTYTINDNIASLQATVVYYKLKMIEKGSQFKYSNVISFRTKLIKNVMSIAPNPAVTYFMVKFNATKEAQATIRVIDANGRAVITQNTKMLVGSNTVTFNNINTLAAGTYNVQVMLDGQLYNEKLMIVK